MNFFLGQQQWNSSNISQFLNFPEVDESSNNFDQVFRTQKQKPTIEMDRNDSIIKNNPTKCRRIKKTRKTKPKKFKTDKNKKAKKNKLCDYRKNICGYITKKALRELGGDTYKEEIQSICELYHADYEHLKDFYGKKIQRVTGPSHIPELVTPKSKDQIYIVRAFIHFFIWFLKEKYIRHLFLEGKMEDRKAYIEYKNKELLPLITHFQRQLDKNQQSSTFIQFNAVDGV